MSIFSRIVPLGAAALLAAAAAGCGGPPAIPADQAGAVPVFNPSADNPLKDVTLANEYQFQDKIGGMSGPKHGRSSKKK